MEEEAAAQEEARDRFEGCAVKGPRALHCAVSIATVSGSNPDSEDCLIGQQQWQVIQERRTAG